MAIRDVFSLVAWNILFLSWTNAVDKDENKMRSSCRQSDCLRCDLGSSQCVKCLHLMILDTRTCVYKCPHGLEPHWADEGQVFGRICQERSILAMVSYREVGIIAGASVLGAICVGVFVGVLLLRRNGSKLPPDSPPRGLPRSLQDKRPKTAEVVVKGKERAEFLTRLRLLRADAPYIFRMMAATRNRFRSGSAAGHEAPSDAKTKACKAVLRDLSRVLCLVSLKEENLQTAPKDWQCLLSWTERLLARYKRQEELKAMGEGFGDSLKGTAGYSGETRTLFVTRQQQLKAEQERRRLEAKALLTDGSKDGADSSSQNGTLESTPKHPDSHPYKSISESKEFIQAKSTDEKCDSDFTAADLPLRTTTQNNMNASLSRNGNKNKLRNFLNLNKILWLNLLSLKGNGDHDLEKGSQKVLNGSPDYEDFSPGPDDISSEIFFKHIEAFAFDLENIPEDNGQTNESHDDNQDTNTKENISLSNKKYTNNLELYKNYKNSRILSGDRPTFNFLRECTEIQQNLGQEKRPSKLRRLSSSILMKDKRFKTLSKEDQTRPKKRRPLKRQKQVSKEKRTIMHEKYQTKNPDQLSSVQNKEQQSTVEILNTSISQNTEGSDDLYLSVIKTPVCKRSSRRKMINVSPSHYKAVLKRNSSGIPEQAHIQQSEDSKIKIKVPSINPSQSLDRLSSENQNVIHSETR